MSGLSVVVAAFSGAQALSRCLDSLTAQSEVTEVVVACADAGAATVTAGLARVQLREAPAGANVFELRSLGVAAAQGDRVALTEDHCVANPGWAGALLDAHAAGHAIVGGPVEAAAGLSSYLRALHLCEYIEHLPPLPDGPAAILSGLNVSYRRHALERCRETWRRAFYENEVHDALRKEGIPLHRACRAIVTARLAFPPAQAARHLLAGGRRYGARRAADSTAARRLLLRLLAPAVPMLLLTRLFLTLARRRPGWLPLALAALPHEIALVGAWSLGEGLGYWSRRETR